MLFAKKWQNTIRYGSFFFVLFGFCGGGYVYLLSAHWSSGYSVRQWHCRSGFNLRSSHTKDSKMALDASLLITQHYKVRIKGKVEQSMEKNNSPPLNTLVKKLLKREPSGKPRLRLAKLTSLSLFKNMSGRKLIISEQNKKKQFSWLGL